MEAINTCIKVIKETCLEHPWAYAPVAIIATLAYWLGVPYIIISALVTLFVVDFITGIAASAYEHRPIISGWNGLLRSVAKAIGYSGLIVAVWSAGSIFVHYFGVPLETAKWILILTVGMGAFNELWSIRENTIRMGIDPTYLKDWLDLLKRKLQ